MKQIRYNVFETNSSSMHSLSLSENNNDRRTNIDLYISCTGTLNIPVGQFGKERCTYDSMSDKLAYLRALYLECPKYYGEIQSKEDFVYKLRTLWPQIKQVNFLDERFEDDERCEYHGEIDHQSRDLLEEENVSFEEFLTKPYVLTTDCD